MNTYRVYVLNTAIALAPTVTIAYVRGEKYGDAWKSCNAILNGEAPKDVKLFTDAECTVDAKLGSGSHLKTAKVEDIKPRNAKFDKAKLAEIMGDAKMTPAAKLKAIEALTGTTAGAAAA